MYKLYDLTYDEVLIVDAQPPFSREEYEALKWPEELDSKALLASAGNYCLNNSNIEATVYNYLSVYL
ncbi:MAG: hypothetical protein U5L09_16180 [Bacteroidales bacterium]|nr:hypothetical protein [Bacteroidales bacterium]